MRKLDLAKRRARVRRINAKRPPITVTATYAPSEPATTSLVDLLFGLLADRVRVKGR